MAIDYAAIRNQIQEYGQDLVTRSQSLQEKLGVARHLLGQHAASNAALQELVERAAAKDAHVRCAIPGSEPLNAAIPAGPMPSGVWLIAADGSQAAPDPHAEVGFGLVNVGMIRMQSGSPEAPQVQIISTLLLEDALPGVNLSIDQINLLRDQRERGALLDLTRQLQEDGALVIALTDGVLELWGTKTSSPEERSMYREALKEHQRSLRELAALNAATGGYVDRPRADLLVRLLAMAASPDNLDLALGRDYPLQGINDRLLLDPVLPPGTRSAVFGLQSQSREDYTGEIALHFFYLNVAAPGSSRPHLARVEIPRWVAESPQLTGLLHSALLWQSQMTGTRPYPYLLHRAHEAAVVHFADRDQITQMLINERMRYGLAPDLRSNKQDKKDLATRTRIK